MSFPRYRTKRLLFGAFLIFLGLANERKVPFLASANEENDSPQSDTFMKSVFSNLKDKLGAKFLEVVQNKFAGVIFEDSEKKKLEKKAKKCRLMLLDKKIPSAENGDAPLSKFGYPHFDEDSKMTILRPGVSLSHMYNFYQPIKIGAGDFIIAGPVKGLHEFAKCFGEYGVVPSYLGEDGKWTVGGGFYIQLQDTVPIKSAHGSVKAIMFRRSIDKILKNIKPDMIITPELLEILPSNVQQFAQSITKGKEEFYHLLQWLPSNNKEKALKLWEQLRKSDSITGRMEILSDFITKAGVRRENPNWEGLEHIDMDGSPTLTITSYPAPDHGNRATCFVKCTDCKMKDIAKALEKLAK